MRRIQIHIDDTLDAAAEAEAARRGMSKAALIRVSVANELGVTASVQAEPWQSVTGWLDDDPVDNIDDVIYGPSR